MVGNVDEHGSRVVGCGKMDNGTDQEVKGDTLFDFASITKPFTGLLLQDMIERGEMKLDDPVQKYLPVSVKMPTRNGKQITLLHLVTHNSGLPHLADNLNPKRPDNPFADYTVEELNTFLEMTHATTHFLGATFSHEKTSEQPPKAYEPLKPRVPIKLDTKLLDACVGDFEFAPSKAFPTGIKATIRREGEQLLWQARGQNAFPGAFNIYPESETNFIFKMSGARLTFIKNDHGGVTAVSLHDGTWLPLPDGKGRKLKHE